jgi:hypothetical protein
LSERVIAWNNARAASTSLRSSGSFHVLIHSLSRSRPAQGAGRGNSDHSGAERTGKEREPQVVLSPARESRQGRMKTHRISIRATLVALGIAALAPAAAGANPLLTGYGGPGQGNQAILGSALLNGSAGGSGGGSSIAAEPAAGASQSAAAPVAGAPTRKRRDASSKPGNASKSSSHAYRPSARASTLAVQEASQPLGLSGTDLLDLFLVSGGLVLTGAITRRMARRAH